jgi:hypothetical protein
MVTPYTPAQCLSFPQTTTQNASNAMADPPSPFEFEDVPLDQARRMEPMLYDTLRQKIQSLSTDATRIHLGPEMTPQRMKNGSATQVMLLLWPL